MPASLANAYHVSPRASRACRSCAGRPGGEGFLPVPGLGGMSRRAASRVCACRARASSVSRRLTCFSFLGLMDCVSVSRFGDFIGSHRDYRVSIDLFVNDNDVPVVGCVAEDAWPAAGTADALRFI